MEPAKFVIPRWFWITLSVIVVIGAIFFTWYFLIGPGKEAKTSDATGTNLSATTATTTPIEEAVGTCDLDQVTGLKAGTTWDIQGGEDFSTAVCGYLMREDVYNEMDDVTNNIAKLVITSYKDAEFKQVIEAGISEGNTVNAATGSNYVFGLGCYRNGQIVFNVANELDLGSMGIIDVASTAKLENATATEPVAVKLEFMEHLGSGCNCCNLAEIVEVQ
jgi:hypothetical protein